MEAATNPFVTIVVPVRNEAKCIERTLTKLALQRYPAERFEIIVADGRSTDETAAIVRGMSAGYSNIRLIDNPGRLSSAARNIGIRHGRGDYFIVIDGHCDIDDPEYIRKAVRAFEQSGADCLGRPQPLEIGEASSLQEAIAIARRSWLGHNPSSHIYSSQSRFVKASSVAVAYRRHVFETVGQFDEQFDACEDVEFNHRIDQAGMTCWFAPEIAVHYHPRTTMRGLMNQMSRYGRGRIRLAGKHPRSLTAPALAPMIFFATVLTCAVAAFWSDWFAVVGALAVVAYAAVVSATSLMLSRRCANVRAKLLLPAVFAAIHLGFAWGTATEFYRQFRTLAWRWSPSRQPNQSIRR